MFLIKKYPPRKSITKILVLANEVWFRDHFGIGLDDKNDGASHSARQIVYAVSITAEDCQPGFHYEDLCLRNGRTTYVTR